MARTLAQTKVDPEKNRKYWTTPEGDIVFTDLFRLDLNEVPNLLYSNGKLIRGFPYPGETPSAYPGCGPFISEVRWGRKSEDRSGFGAWQEVVLVGKLMIPFSQKA